MLTLQQMIDGVLAGAEGQALSKIAQAAEEDADEMTASEQSAEGEGKAPPRTKREAERQADKEEKAQGGGQDNSESEDTDQERVEKMASAVEEVVRVLLNDAHMPVGRVVTAEEGVPMETALKTDDNKTPEAETANFGTAKAQIPTNPPQEKVQPAESGNSAMATDEDKRAIPAPAEKIGSLQQYTAGLLMKNAEKIDPRVQRAAMQGGAIGGGVLGAARGAYLGQQAGMGAVPGALLGGAVGAGRGALGGRILESEFTKRNPVTGTVGSVLVGDIPGAAGAYLGKEIKRGKIEEEQSRRPHKRKTAADPSSPQASISGAKSNVLPEDRPLNAPLAAGAETQRAMLASNEAAMNLTKLKAKAQPKQDLAALLSERAMARSTDKALDQTLGAQQVDQAGAKIASQRKLKIAAARALITKIAAEGCTCEEEGLEKGQCRYCKVASRLEAKEGSSCASEKKAQMGDVPAASNVPATVQSSASPAAGGMPPQM